MTDSDPSQQPGTTDAAAESREYDFGPYRVAVVKLWQGVIRLKSGSYEVVQANEPQVQAKYAEIVRLSAEALIDSDGEIVESDNILGADKSKGVFRALHEAFTEASKDNPTYCMPSQTQELNFTRKIAAEAVRILLARQKAPAQPVDDAGPEVAAVAGETRAGVEEV